jgi:hypothetical protein
MKKKNRYGNRRELRTIHINNIPYQYQWAYFSHNPGMYFWIGKKKFSIENLWRVDSWNHLFLPSSAKEVIMYALSTSLPATHENSKFSEIKLVHHG